MCTILLGTHDLKLRFANKRAMSLPEDGETEHRPKVCVKVKLLLLWAPVTLKYPNSPFSDYSFHCDYDYDWNHLLNDYDYGCDYDDDYGNDWVSYVRILMGMYLVYG